MSPGDFGAWVRATRKERKLSAERLAAAAGLKADAVYALERGERSPEEPVLRKMATRLGLDGDEVVARSGRVPEVIASWLCEEPSRIRELRERMVLNAPGGSSACRA